MESTPPFNFSDYYHQTKCSLDSGDEYKVLRKTKNGCLQITAGPNSKIKNRWWINEIAEKLNNSCKSCFVRMANYPNFDWIFSQQLRIDDVALAAVWKPTLEFDWRNSEKGDHYPNGIEYKHVPAGIFMWVYPGFWTFLFEKNVKRKRKRTKSTTNNWITVKIFFFLNLIAK